MCIRDRHNTQPRYLNISFWSIDKQFSTSKKPVSLCIQVIHHKRGFGRASKIKLDLPLLLLFHFLPEDEIIQAKTLRISLFQPWGLNTVGRIRYYVATRGSRKYVESGTKPLSLSRRGRNAESHSQGAEGLEIGL